MFGSPPPRPTWCVNCARPLETGHVCNPERVAEVIAAREISKLPTEIKVWMEKTIEGRFEVFYAEWSRHGEKEG